MLTKPKSLLKKNVQLTWFNLWFCAIIFAEVSLWLITILGTVIQFFAPISTTLRGYFRCVTPFSVPATPIPTSSKSTLSKAFSSTSRKMTFHAPLTTIFWYLSNIKARSMKICRFGACPTLPNFWTIWLKINTGFITRGLSSFRDRNFSCFTTETKANLCKELCACLTHLTAILTRSN